MSRQTKFVSKPQPSMLSGLTGHENKLELSRLIPFAFLHLGVFAVFWVGWSPIAVFLAIALYWIRMFAITAFYHRYFSHRAFQTGRVQQFIFALLAMSSVQRGPLWWASHHRLHHKATEQPEDPHSPVQHGLFWSHFGWMTTSENLQTDYSRVPDLAKYPELVFLNRYDWIVPAILFILLFVIGVWLENAFPELGTSGWQLVIWGFFISTVVLFHATCTINSLAHCFGTRRYDTDDDSRNNLWLALITMGEGWHNNHHRYQGTVRQGFYWWEIDMTYYLLRLMAWLGLIHNLNPVPVQAYESMDETRPISPQPKPVSR